MTQHTNEIYKSPKMSIVETRSHFNFYSPLIVIIFEHQATIMGVGAARQPPSSLDLAFFANKKFEKVHIQKNHKLMPILFLGKHKFGNSIYNKTGA